MLLFDSADSLFGSSEVVSDFGCSDRQWEGTGVSVKTLKQKNNKGEVTLSKTIKIEESDRAGSGK